MHPNDFKVNDVWIVFQANEAPIQSEEGAFNCLFLMDAASTYIFGHVLIGADGSEHPGLDAQRLLGLGLDFIGEPPAALYVLEDAHRVALADEAARLGVDLVTVEESEVAPIIGDAKDSLPSGLLMPTSPTAH